MPRIPILKPEEMDAEQRRVYDATLKSTGRVGGGPSIAYAYAPGLWETSNAVGAYFDGKSALSPQQVRIVAMVTVRHWNSAFPWAAQSRMGLQAGVDRAIVDAINAKQTPTFASKDDEIVHAVAREVVETGTVSPATFEKAKAVLGYRKLVDTVGLVGQFCKTAFMANLGGAEPPADAPIPMK